VRNFQIRKHFDSYYFDKLKKLNREDAKRAIEHLAQIQEIRDAKIKEKRKKQKEKERELQSPKKTLEELRDKYLILLNEKEITKKEDTS